MSASNHEESELLLPQVPKRNSVNVYDPRHLCVPSKAARLILVWTLVTGAQYATVMYGSVILAYYVRQNISDFSLALVAPYTLFAIVFLFFPLYGFVADIYLGRYRAVILSLGVLYAAFLCVSVDASYLIAENFHFHKTVWNYFSSSFGILGLLLFCVGISGYKANFIQLGLDQLMDSPSRYLGLFVHWVMWCDVVGSCVVTLFFAVYFGCELKVHNYSKTFKVVVACLPYFFLVVLAIMLVSSCYTRRWFYTERGYDNPYKMVLKVLNFARKHKYPLRRCALTFHEDHKPSRLDYAKDRYGGPYTSEQVEDVKTFLRILLVLFCLGPVFVLEVPASYFMFPLFSLHASGRSNVSSSSCTARWIVLKSGSLQYIVSIVFFPVYIWYIYKKRWRVPRILKRLWFGILMFLLTILSMLLIDLTGHLLQNGDPEHKAQCMFGVRLHRNVRIDYPNPLNLPWWVLIVPNVLLGIGPFVVNITTLEFISAQSPVSMKGLLVGVFFAIKGFFQLSGAISVFPFSYQKIWYEGRLKEHPPVVNCAFFYFLFMIIVALVGLVLFTLVAVRYKYRQRGEQPYGPHIVEEVFSNNLSQEMPRTYGIHSPDYSRDKVCDTI